jgi:hypothetical protein
MLCSSRPAILPASPSSARHGPPLLPSQSVPASRAAPGRPSAPCCPPGHHLDTMGLVLLGVRLRSDLGFDPMTYFVRHSWLAWTCDAIDFFSVSLSVTNLSKEFGKNASDIVRALPRSRSPDVINPPSELTDRVHHSHPALPFRRRRESPCSSFVDVVQCARTPPMIMSNAIRCSSPTGESRAWSAKNMRGRT